MCTALTLHTRDHYFGRTLDLETTYGEQVCITPRRFPLPFRTKDTLTEHFAMIGMAAVISDYPLYFEAANEKGLGMAGLNFPGNAFYPLIKEGADNISPFEFIPWILAQCDSVAAARPLLERINLAGLPFASQLPLSPLHWILSDAKESIVVESMADGLHIYDNPLGILTNNPPFPYQQFALNNYRHVGISAGENRFLQEDTLDTYCAGLGGLGLPGDVSSMSRFARIAFLAQHSSCAEDEASSVGQFFHLLSGVEMVRGACLTDGGQYDLTQYTSCTNLEKGLCYYTTYANRQITCVDMHSADLDSDTLSTYPLIQHEQIAMQN